MKDNLIDARKIDRASFEPAYLQLANIIRQQIGEGIFRPGDQLPSEAQLCRRYGISPMTVRRSINLLADQGVVSTAQGRGTFVKEIELSRAVFGLRELEDLFDLGSDGNIKLIDVRIVSADERTARKLDLKIGDATIYIRRLFTRGGTAIFYHRAYFIYDPAKPIVEAEMDVTSLQGLFGDGKNILFKGGHLTIESTLLTNEEADLLRQPMPAPAFYLEHVFFDYENHPTSWGWFIIPSNWLRFTTTVGINDS